MKKLLVYSFNMKRASLCFISLITLLSTLSYAQSYKLNQVIVLNDGNILESGGGQHTRVGSYNPVTKVYQDFDTIAAQFGSHVIIDSGFIYVGADSLLIKYDLNTKAKLATQTVVGIREMAVWGNQILVTAGNAFPLQSYFQAYNKSNLSLVYQDTTISYATEGIQVLNDSAYIAINDFGAGSVGLLGVEDLKGQKEQHEVNLGASGLNPYSVFIEPTNQQVYTVNNLIYNNSTVTDYDTHSAVFNNNSLHLSSGCTSSAYYIGNVYFQPSNDANILVYSTTSLTVWDSLKINKSIYGMGIDSADGYIYVGQTDYVSYGNVFIYDLFGHPIDSFAVDIGPGNFAFDIRAISTNVPQLTNNNLQLTVYPNPTTSMVNIDIQSSVVRGEVSAAVYNVCGEKIYSNTYQPIANGYQLKAIDLTNQPGGVYFLTITTTDGTVIHKKIIKE